MDEQERDAMTVDEAKAALRVSEAWVYHLIKIGRLTTVERRRGRGNHTTIRADDVEKERLKRKELLEKIERRMGGL